MVYGTDISKTGLGLAKEKAKLLNLDNIEFQQHDMRAMPYADNFFDAVACIWSLDVGIVNDIRTTINEIFRILRSNGIMIADFISVDDKTYGEGGEGTS